MSCKITKDGKTAKERNRAYARLWREGNRETTRQRVQETYWRYPERSRLLKRQANARVKTQVFAHYSNGKVCCALCGNDNIFCLSIDHINGLGKQNRKALHRSGCAFYYWLKKQGYPEGYQVLCMNCQFIKKYERREEGGYRYG